MRDLPRPARLLEPGHPGQARRRAPATIAHEMAHQWFGDLVTPTWWDDLWLNESFAEYLGNRVTADATEFDDTWIDMVYSRRQWGLVADQGPSTHPVAGNGAVDASAALQDFDGISYAKGSSILKQLNAIDRRRGLLRRASSTTSSAHRFANATMLDLFESWERAGAGELDDFTTNWLRTSGPDTLALDRAAGVVRRTPPAAHPADRPHTIRVAVGRRRRLGGPHPGARLPGDRRSAGPARRAARSSSTRTPRAGSPRSRTRPRSGRWSTCCRTSRTTCSGPGSGTTCAAATTTASLDPPTCSTSPSRACRWRTPRTPNAARCTGCSARSCRWPGRDAAARVHAAAVGEGRSDRARLGAAARGVPRPSCPRPPTSTRSDVVAGGATCPTASRSTSTCAGGCSSGWRRSAPSTSTGSTPSSPSSRPATRGCTTRRRTPPCPTPEAKAWAWSCFTGEIDVANYELNRRRDRHVARRPGVTSTEPVRRPLLRRPPENGPGAQRLDARETRRSTSSRGTSLDEETLDKAQALVADGSLDLSLRRRLADEADELERLLAVRRAFPG